LIGKFVYGRRKELGRNVGEWGVWRAVREGLWKGRGLKDGVTWGGGAGRGGELRDKVVGIVVEM